MNTDLIEQKLLELEIAINKTRREIAILRFGDKAEQRVITVAKTRVRSHVREAHKRTIWCKGE